jgi:hypothetical protein
VALALPLMLVSQPVPQAQALPSNPALCLALMCVSVNDVSVVEGDVAPVDALFVVTLSDGVERLAAGTVKVDYTAAAVTADGGHDFKPVTGTVEFAPGRHMQTISVPVLPDTIDEPDETFTVNLANPRGGLVGPLIIKGSGTGTIVDNDVPRPDSPQVSVTDSSADGFTAHVELPRPVFVPFTGGGRAFTAFRMQGMGTFPRQDAVAELGQPGVPGIDIPFALPCCTTTFTADVVAVRAVAYDGVDIAPAQPDPSDDGAFGRPDGTGSPEENFFVPPFVMDDRAYMRNASFPSAPAMAGQTGVLRELQVGSVRLFGGQFNPVRHHLDVFRSVDVRVRFGRNEGSFGPSSITGVWDISWRRMYEDLIVNWGTVLDHLLPFRELFCGEELLILSTPALEPAANQLANFRNNTSGIVTKVFTVGAEADIANFRENIRAFVRGELSSDCSIRPSYLLLMGDHPELVASRDDTVWGTVGNDLYYALADDTDILPDIAVGRIPAQTLDEATRVVNKVIAYETTPPSDPTFYTKTFAASYFQGDGPTDDRSYVRTSETIRNFLLGQGFDVQRIYSDDGSNVNEQDYDDGSALPSELLKANGFAWNGNAADINAAVSDGRFLVYQRDHGSADEWSNPVWNVSNFASLTNAGELPVAFSIDCTSGYYDDDDGIQHHAERLLLEDGGGAVGVVAASRVSPTGTNDNFAIGLYDAMFPSFVAYGSGTALTRMGDVMNHGKLYATTTDGLTHLDLRLYQYFGDPTMQIHAEKPFSLDPSSFIYRIVNGMLVIRWNLPDPPPDGTLVTLFERIRLQSTPIGRALLDKGQAMIPIGDRTTLDGIVAFDKDGYLPASTEIHLGFPR